MHKRVVGVFYHVNLGNHATSLFEVDLQVQRRNDRKGSRAQRAKMRGSFDGSLYSSFSGKIWRNSTRALERLSFPTTTIVSSPSAVAVLVLVKMGRVTTTPATTASRSKLSEDELGEEALDLDLAVVVSASTVVGMDVGSSGRDRPMPPRANESVATGLPRAVVGVEPIRVPLPFANCMALMFGGEADIVPLEARWKERESESRCG